MNKDELMAHAQARIAANRETYIAQWLLQNPDAKMDDYCLATVRQADGSETFMMEHKTDAQHKARHDLQIKMDAATELFTEVMLMLDELIAQGVGIKLVVLQQLDAAVGGQYPLPHASIDPSGETYQKSPFARFAETAASGDPLYVPMSPAGDHPDAKH